MSDNLVDPALVEAVARAMAENDPDRGGGDYHPGPVWRSYVGAARQQIAAYEAIDAYRRGRQARD